MQLQTAIGNHAVGRVLTPANSPAPSLLAVQRVVIDKNTVDGLGTDLDTSDLETAMRLVNGLFEAGKRRSLVELYLTISNANQREKAGNNDKLMRFIEVKLKATTESVPENSPSGLYDTLLLKAKYLAQTASDDSVRNGLRMWVSGDPRRGIGWNMVGKHLRGRLSAQEYQQIGVMYHLAQDQQNGTDLANAPSDQQEQAGRQLLDRVRDDIRGALDALPAHDGVSYRQAGVKDCSVYGGSINVGDYIRDTTFWSTSALRISGSAGTWGQDGTQQRPKVYFLIAGTTGKYIAKYAGQEEGQHEVLYKDNATFQVTKIANFRDETFFVHVSEVDPSTVPAGQAKNPYTGD